MAKIRIQNVVEQLDYDMKRSLESAVQEILPNSEFDRNELFRAFVRAIGRKFSNWVDIRDQDFEK